MRRLGNPEVVGPFFPTAVSVCVGLVEGMRPVIRTSYYSPELIIAIM